MPISTSGAPPASDRTRLGFFNRTANWVLVIPVLLLAAMLTVPHLNGAFWVDEVITVQRAGSPINGGPFSPAQIWNHTATTSYDQVPGYYMLVSVWDNLLGFSEYATRLLSLVAGLLAIALVYRLGRTLHSPLAGLGAATALAVSEHMIKFMHEGRTYALLVLLGAVLIWCYWRLITGHHAWWVQGGLLLAAAGLLYSHYFASLLVFSVCAYHLLFVPKNREWWRVVILMGAAGALFLPWVLPNFDAVQGANNQGWRQAMAMSAPELTNEVLTFFSNNNLALLLLVGGFALHLRRPANRLLWFLLLVPIIMGLVVNIWLGMLVSSKFYLYLWGPLALLFGIGVVAIARRGLHPVYLLLPWVIAGVWVVVNAQEDPVKYIAWDVLHDQLAGQTTADDRIIFHLQATDWDGAHNRGVEYYFHDFPRLPQIVWSWPHAADAVYVDGIRAAITDPARVWSSYDPQHAPARITTVFEPEMHSAGFASCGRVITEDLMNVDLFARPPQAGFNFSFSPDSDSATGAVHLDLLGAITHLKDGQLLIPLGWQMDQALPVNTYSYAVHIFDANGALVTQADNGFPPDYDFSCQALKIDAQTLPAGDYHLGLLVYAWETGQRLTGLDARDQHSGEYIDLGDFHVE